MTTEKLIEIAKKCSHKNHCPLDCPYLLSMMSGCEDELLAEVTDKLEKAYAALKSDCDCRHCEYYDICEQGGDDIPICTDGNLWECAGDSK